MVQLEGVQATDVVLEHALPRSRIVDETRLSVWVRCNRPGASLALRIVFPHQTDPRTGRPLWTLIEGETYTKTGMWQQLQCKTPDRLLKQKIVWLRGLVESDIDTREVYADQVVLRAGPWKGPIEFFLDEMKFGPTIDAEAHGTVPNGVVQVDQSRSEAATRTPAQFRLDRLSVGGRPFFPRILLYHNEKLSDLARMRYNVLWIPDFEDRQLLGQMREAGLWAAAIPPRALGRATSPTNADTPQALVFGPETERILFWYLGTAIPAAAKRDLTEWTQDLWHADRRIRRPLMADVDGLERSYSRLIPMLGSSRYALHSSVGFKEYRNWILSRRNLARGDVFSWSWVNVEPSPIIESARQGAAMHRIVIEPEQLRLQVYAGLAAGIRGVGYWSERALDEELPGNEELRLMQAILNMELELLEPWLATGAVRNQVGFSVDPSRTGQIGQLGIDFGGSRDARTRRELLLKQHNERLAREARRGSELEATIIQTDSGLLLLPIWYEQGAQFVPGQMAANNAKITVAGAPEAATAWEISPTGIRLLKSEPKTGGLAVTLEKFDSTAAILVTSQVDVIARLKRKARAMSREYAALNVQLAQLKLRRVTAIDRELASMERGQHDADRLIRLAEKFVVRAHRQLGHKQFYSARQSAGSAMQALRILQRAHWNDAVRKLSQPLASPHTLCFQTLPDHWRLLQRLGTARWPQNANLLRSGDFEDIDTMVAERWEHKQNAISGITAAAELNTSRVFKGDYSLRLAAIPTPGKVPPNSLPVAPVTLTTPLLPIRAGQILHISGWVRVENPVHSTDGVLFYDNLGGTELGLRWWKTEGWEYFEMIREVSASGKLSLTLSLTGLGEVWFDQLRVIPHQPKPRSPLGTPTQNTTRR